MGEPSFYCHPSPEGCCLELHETILILVALIVLVQLALKLAAVICYYLCHLLGSLCAMVFAKAPEPARAPARRAQCRRPSARWSQEDAAPRHCRRSESSSPRRRCLHCTLEPLRVTMDLQQPEPCPFRQPRRAGRRSHADYPPCPARYCDCDCEWRPRPRPASAPSGYGVTRYRDVGCGSSDPLLRTGASATEERRITTPLSPLSPMPMSPLSPMPMSPMSPLSPIPMSPLSPLPMSPLLPPGSDPFPRTQVGETHYRPASTGQDTEFLPTTPTTGGSRARRPAKVYIYPVHPQTPPGSRSPSPERSYRRRANASGLSGPDEPPEFEPRESRRKARDAEQKLGLSGTSRFHNLSASPGPGGASPAETKSRFYWNEQLSGQDWVYRPLK